MWPFLMHDPPSRSSNLHTRALPQSSSRSIGFKHTNESPHRASVPPFTTHSIIMGISPAAGIAILIVVGFVCLAGIAYGFHAFLGGVVKDIVTLRRVADEERQEPEEQSEDTTTEQSSRQDNSTQTSLA